MTNKSQTWTGNRAIDLLSIASFPKISRASKQSDVRSCKVVIYLDNKTED